MDWNGGIVKPPAFEDEGALHVGKGRFLLFMSGDKDGKQLSPRMKVILGSVAAIAVITALIITVLLVGHQPNSIPYRLNLRDLLGSELGTISSELKVSESDWVQQSDGVYQLKEPLTVSGISYKLLLNFDANAKLRSFEYVADYKADTGKAAADINKAVIDLRLQGEVSDSLDEVELKTSSLRKYFKQNRALDTTVSVCASYQSSDTDAVGQYLKKIETDPAWPGLLHGYVVQPAAVYETTRVGYTPETESVLIHIICQIEPKRTN